MELEDSTGSGAMLADNTMEGLEAPPELPLEPAGLQRTALAVAATPQQPVAFSVAAPYSQPHSVFPGTYVEHLVWVNDSCINRSCLCEHLILVKVAAHLFCGRILT